MDLIAQRFMDTEAPVNENAQVKNKFPGINKKQKFNFFVVDWWDCY